MRQVPGTVGFRSRSIIGARQSQFANYAHSPRLGGGPCQALLDIRRPRGRGLRAMGAGRGLRAMGAGRGLRAMGINNYGIPSLTIIVPTTRGNPAT